MSERIGIYAGTFDPVHAGHLAFAVAALRACDLDRVLFLPEPTPRGKVQVTELRHRTAMLALASQAESRLAVLELPDAQFTVQRTLPKLRRRFGDAELTLLLGSDVVMKSLPHWTGMDALLRQVALAVGLRHEDDEAGITAVLDGLSAQTGEEIAATLVPSPQAAVASSHIRAGAMSPAALDPAVAAYIRRQKLYGN